MILESNKKSTGNPGKGSGTDVLSLHYIIIDGLTSSWREFLALQEMSSKVQLAQCVLTAETKGRLFELATPTGLESQNQEGLRYFSGLLFCAVLNSILFNCIVLNCILFIITSTSSIMYLATIAI